MFRPRIIPVLLLKNRGLVKSIKFKNYRYLGDPINAVKLFNDLGADELAFLDITANSEDRTISCDFVKNVGDEANMPFSVGGGIRNLKDIQLLIAAGAEKVIINSYAVENPGFITEAANEFGSSSISISIDVKKNLFGKDLIYTHSGRKSTRYNPLDFAKIMEDMGAGEIILNSIDEDGMMQGYNLSLIRKISQSVKIPVVALGGAGNLNDLRKVVLEGFASAAAASSIFVYHGARKAVLINYPDNSVLKGLFSQM